MHHCLVTRLKLERDRECNVTLLVQRARIVAEVHVVAIDGHPLAIMREQVGRFEYLGDEHCPLSGWGRRQKVQVLPDRSANGARDPNVVLEARQAAFDSQRYEFRHDSSTLDPEPTIVEESEVTRCVADHEASKSLVSDENVGSESEHEIFDVEITGSGYSPCQIICRCCIVKEIGWTADLECGVLSKRLIALEPLGV